MSAGAFRIVLAADHRARETADALARHLDLRRQTPTRHALVALDTADGRCRRCGLTVTAAPLPEGIRLRAARDDAPEQVAHGSAGNLILKASDLPESPLRSLLVPILGTRALLPLLRLDWMESVLVVRTSRGTLLGRLVLETERVSSVPGAASTPLPDAIRWYPAAGGSTLRREIEALAGGPPTPAPRESGLPTWCLRHVPGSRSNRRHPRPMFLPARLCAGSCSTCSP